MENRRTRFIYIQYIAIIVFLQIALQLAFVIIPE